VGFQVSLSDEATEPLDFFYLLLFIITFIYSAINVYFYMLFMITFVY